MKRAAHCENGISAGMEGSQLQCVFIGLGAGAAEKELMRRIPAGRTEPVGIFFLQRIEKGVRAPAIIVVYFPAALLILKWSQFKETWSELGTAVLIGFAVFLTWWIPIGRNLPPPKGSQIIVITDDDDEE